MGYSIYNVDDLDIDQEHANIDVMLSCLSEDDDQARKELAKLIDALVAHLEHEEKLATQKGYAMTDSHRLVHAEMREQLAEMKESLQYIETECEFIAGTIQEMLRQHIIEYDRFLKSPTSKDDSTVMGS